MKKIIALALVIAMHFTATSQLNYVWTWIGGTNLTKQNGIYGTKGTPSTGNIPGGRKNSQFWKGNNGKFYLFGGFGMGNSGTSQLPLNDMWSYDKDTREWTWLSGDSSQNTAGVYGTQGVADAANYPGSRHTGVTWTDASTGSLYLFAGFSFNPNGDRNDVWKYDVSTGNWTWMKGSSTTNAYAVYGTTGVEASGNTIGSREVVTSWRDAAGYFWVFGGFGNLSSGSSTITNQLWRYNPATNNWAFMGGSLSASPTGTYGTLGVEDVANWPGGRTNSTTWVDSNGKLWLFGGNGYATTATSGNLNDLWSYDPATGKWTWQGGTQTTGSAGVFGTQGTASTSNYPPGLQGGASWVDSSGNFWIAGGGQTSDYNALWKYTPSTGQWTWVKGSSTTTLTNTYGTKDVPLTTNVMGGRRNVAIWKDSQDSVYIFSSDSYANDLWRLSTCETPTTPSISAGSATTFCNGGSVTLTSSAADKYQWYKNGTIISGATSQAYSATATGTYTVMIITNAGCTATSVGTSVTVNSIPTTPTISAGSTTTFCDGGSVTLTSSATSGNQWYVDGSPVSAATNRTYAATTSGSYTVISTVSGCSSSASAAKVVTVNPIPSTPTASAGSATTFCSGGSVTLTSSSTTGNQWYKDGSPLTGSTSQDYSTTVSGSYTVKVTSNSCMSAASSAVVVTVNSIPSTPTISAGGSTTICSSSSVTLTSSSSTGNQWYKNGSPIGGATAQTYAASTTGSYTLVVTTNGCSSASSAATSVTANTCYASCYWTGTTSTDWNTASNWSCGSVPNGSAYNVIVPSATNAPVLAGNVEVNNITFQSTTMSISLNGNTLTIDSIVSGGGTFKGSNTSSLVLAGPAGTIKFLNGYNTLNNLTLSGNASATLGATVGVYGDVTVGTGATLAANGYLNIKSSPTATGRVAPSLGTITGSVVVERYIPRNTWQAWRLLSVPVQGSGTFRSAWQENQAPMVIGTNGYGTLMGQTTGTGFDYVAIPSVATSVKTWDAASGAWVAGVSSTSNTMQTRSGYLLYIKGDRSVTPGMSTNTTNETVLRTTGTLYQGTQVSPAVPANKYAVIGNIYASAVDFNLLTKDTTTGMYNTFYLWDPKLYGTNGAGAYQTFAKANGWVPSPGGGSFAAGVPNTIIQSGAAFMVYGKSAGGTITFTESAKTTGNANVFTRDAAITRLSATLKVQGQQTPADGNTVVFSLGYSENVPKPSNLGENFSIVENNQSVAVSAKATAAADGDRVAYLMTNLKEGQQYIIEMNAENFNGQQAYLEDSYLHTSTPLDMNGKTTISFTANSSSNGRFTIVFGKSAATPAIAGAGRITVAPNPVTGRTANIQFSNKAEGAYKIALTNAAGQSVYTTTVNHTGNSSTQLVKLPKLAQGTYQMQITSADGKTESQGIVVSN